jgi:hypothetical protein
MALRRLRNAMRPAPHHSRFTCIDPAGSISGYGFSVSSFESLRNAYLETNLIIIQIMSFHMSFISNYMSFLCFA